MGALIGLGCGITARPNISTEENLKAVFSTLRQSGDTGVVPKKWMGVLPAPPFATGKRAGSSLGKQIIKVLKNRTYAASTSSIQKHIGKFGKHKMQSVSPALQAMVKEGTLTAIGAGHKLKYKLVPTPPE